MLLQTLPSRGSVAFHVQLPATQPIQASEVAKAKFFLQIKNLLKHLPDGKDVHGLRPSEACLGRVGGRGGGGRLRGDVA